MILYVLSLLVSINSVLFAGGGYKIVDYKDNIVPKVFFWPVLSISVFAITASSFY